MSSKKAEVQTLKATVIRKGVRFVVVAFDEGADAWTVTPSWTLKTSYFAREDVAMQVAYELIA